MQHIHKDNYRFTSATWN